MTRKTLSDTPGRYQVETGVKGAYRINVRYFETLSEALARAERWASSNSTGEYWAEVIDNGLDPDLTPPAIVRRFNL